MPAQTSQQRYERAVREYRAAYGALKAYCERMETVRSSYPGNDLWMSAEYDNAVTRLDRAERQLLAAYENCQARHSPAPPATVSASGSSNPGAPPRVNTG